MSIDFESFDPESYRGYHRQTDTTFYIIIVIKFSTKKKEYIYIYIIYYDVDQTTFVLINATHITYIIHVIQYKVTNYCRKSRVKTAFIECK